MTDFARKSLVFCLVGVAAVLVGCGGGGGGGGSSDAATDLIVQQVLPTNGQEVNSGLTDPGLEGVITMKFSERLMPSSVLDPNNAFNGLTSDVNVLNSAFERVRGTPTIAGDRSNILTFFPAGGDLPNGQYTVTVTRDVMNYQGGRLNNGRYDHRSSFTVGTDIWDPVVRNTFPAPNQTEVPKDSQIIITFNESLNPATVSSATVAVADGGTAPPTPINGTLTLSRDDFEVVFTPDPANPMPANATIIVTVLGGPSGVTDVVGNPFNPDPGNNPNQFQFQFKTVVEPPLPANTWHLDPANPPLDGSVYYGTASKVGTIAELPFVVGLITGQFDLTDWGINNPVQYSETKIGRPGEMLVDPRFNPIDGHSYVYIVDLNTGSVVVYGTRDSRIVYRWKEFRGARGLAQSGGSTLWVTEAANDSVSAVNIGAYITGQPVASTQLKAAAYNRQIFKVGRSPQGAAHFPDRNGVMIANYGDDSITELNTSTGQTVATLTVGAGPKDVSVTNLVFVGLTPIGWFAWVSCEGGIGDAEGSVALWWDNIQSNIARQASGIGSIQAIMTGFRNPNTQQYDYGTTGDGLRSAFVCNRAGDFLSKVSINISGGGVTYTFLPSKLDVKVGNNPSGVCIDPVLPPNGFAPVIISADSGSSQLSFLRGNNLISPHYEMAIPGVNRVCSIWSQ